MKPHPIDPKSRLPGYGCALVLGILLTAAAGPVLADDLIVNSFDFGLSGIAWENWRGYISGHAESWDSAQDADSNPGSGSMYVTVNWPLSTDPTWNNGWNDVQVAFAAGSFASADYLEVEAYIKIDVPNSFPALDGGYGVVGLYVNGGSGGWQQVQGYANLTATTGWQRIHGSLAGIPAQTYDSVVVGFISNGGSSLTNNVSYWLDNVRLIAPPSVNTNQPALTIAKAPPAGLTCLASAPNDAWQRQMIRTVGSAYSWDTGTAVSNTTTYSINLAAFPGKADSGFEAMMYLIPLNGMSSPDDQSVDWDSAHVAYFTVTANADGTGRGNFRYKVNSANAETFHSWTDFNCATGPLGTWALSFYYNTNVTIKAPDGTSTTFAIPSGDAANFQGDLMAYFGVRPTDPARIGRSATFGRIQITGAAAAVNDTFVSAGPPYDLDAAVWVRKAASPQGIFVTAPDTRYWVSWPQPDGGFANLYATDDLKNKLGAAGWLSLPVAETGWLNVAGQSRLATVSQSMLNAAFSHAPTNCFFGLFHE